MPDQDQQADAPPAEPAEKGQVEAQVTPTEIQAIPEETWEKRYKDSQREFEKKWKPVKDKADFIAQQVGFQDVDGLYEAVRADQMAKDKSDVQLTPVRTPAAQQTAAIPPELDKRISSLEADKKEKRKQEIDKEFESFYGSFPEAKEMEPELIALAKPLWSSKGKKGYKYEHLSDALQDAYLVLNKEKFMEKEKLEAFAKYKAEQGATQSLLGNTSKSKKTDSEPSLTPDEERIFQAQKSRGVFKTRKEYLQYKPK